MGSSRTAANPMHRTRSTPLLAALLLAACAAPRQPALQFDDRELPLDARDFPVPERMRLGFDPRASGEWRVGDEVLFGLRLRKAGGERNWLLKLRVLDPEVEAAAATGPARVDWRLRINGVQEAFASRLCRVEAIVMDRDGVVLGRSEPRLPRDFLASGVAAACALVARRAPERVRAAGARPQPQALALPVRNRELARATVCAVSLLQVVQDDAVLAPLLWEVVEKPSLWSVVTNLGAAVVLRPRFHHTASVRSPIPGNYDPTWTLPLGLEVNGAPALELELFVAEPEPPYALCGGLFGATARHPRRADLEFSLLLLSARRGR